MLGGQHARVGELGSADFFIPSMGAVKLYERRFISRFGILGTRERDP